MTILELLTVIALLLGVLVVLAGWLAWSAVSVFYKLERSDDDHE